MASIKDVARIANVGISTVSRVINNSGFVSKETREIVLKTIKQLNYTPNELARNFQKKQTNLIGVIVPEITQKFNAELLSRLEKDLSDLGYFVMLGVSNHTIQREIEYLEKLRSQQVAGIIITAPFINENVSESYKELPIVSFDRFISKHIPCVHIDNYKAGKELTEKLISKSNKKIAYVGFGADLNSLAQERKLAFVDECEKMDKQYILLDNLNKLSDIDYIKDVYHKTKDCDGYFFACDNHALVFINILKNKGVKVNKDVFIVGFDGIEDIFRFEPILTTAVQPMGIISKELIKALMKRINEVEVDYDIVVNYSIIEGQTC